MPTRPCLTKGCPNLTSRSRCGECERETERARRQDGDLTGRRNRPTPTTTRRRVLRRDRHRCRRCGARERLEVHHVNGVRGDNRMVNLMTLCTDCHRRLDRVLGIWR